MPTPRKKPPARKPPPPVAGRRDPSDSVDFASDFGINNDDFGDEAITISVSNGSAAFLPISVLRAAPEVRAILGDIQDVVLARQKLLRDLDRLVLEARDLGASWNILGWSTGMAGTNARKRWNGMTLDEGDS